MSFKITIEETKIVTKPLSPQWEQLRTDSAEMGYTPQIEAAQESVMEVYMQRIDTLDLVAVIKAINVQ